MSELVGLFEDFAEVAATVMLVYVIYKVALLIDTLNRKIKDELP